MTTFNVHRLDPDNLGDLTSSPALYFPDLFTSTLDSHDLSWPEDAHLIFGGGGLLHADYATAIANTPRSPNRRLITWAIGHNQHDTLPTTYHDWLTGFDLVGTRDFNHNQPTWHYVPCPSCLHTGFDATYPLLHEAVIYEHHAHSIPIDLPREHNRHPLIHLPRVLAHIASAPYVITNSYHGAYWAMLLNRTPILYHPFASRFYTFQHQPRACTALNWREQLQPNPTLANYLTTCRQLNHVFKQLVQSTL
jgi:hypothetical protein